MNLIRLINIDTAASPRPGFACAFVSQAYRFLEDKAVTFSLGNEDETGMT
jgi:hypothetical protein